jgi:hypothetical protein
MKFCPSCGTALEGATRFCAQCGAALAPKPAPPAPTPTVTPTDGLPPLRAAPTQVNWAALVVGLLALALIAGGLTFLLMRDDGPDTTATTAAQLPPTTVATVATTVATTVVPLEPAAQLAATRDADRPAVEALVGQWVPQLSAKREGSKADGIVYAAADIVALHARLHAQYGAVLVWSGEYVFEQGDLWISIAPKGFATPEEALAWCTAASLDRDNCLAKLITHDASVGDTARLQP